MKTVAVTENNYTITDDNGNVLLKNVIGYSELEAITAVVKEVGEERGLSIARDQRIIQWAQILRRVQTALEAMAEADLDPRQVSIGLQAHYLATVGDALQAASHATSTLELSAKMLDHDKHQWVCIEDEPMRMRISYFYDQPAPKEEAA